MRKIDTTRFRVATQRTSREINRTIVLNLVRARQPLSRADLARAMGMRRGAVSLIVNELLKDGSIFEGATGDSVRGRKPTFLYIDSRRRLVVAIDIRVSQTLLMLADLVGQPIGGVVTIPTERDPKKLVKSLAARIKQLLVDHHGQIDACTGIGVAVPGMVERPSMRVLHAPTLGWRDVDLRDMLAKATGIPVEIENSGRVCALAQLWAMHGGESPGGDFVFVSASDGLGVGVSFQREVLRGRHNLAGEFGHLLLSMDGPRCSCGSNGCWEAYVSNRATLARYFGQEPEVVGAAEPPDFSIDDLIARARGGDLKARAAIQATGKYLGVGLALLVNGLDPSAVYVGGEITGAWELIEPPMRAAFLERALTPAVAATVIRPVATIEYPRLRGAAALVTAPAFAAPVVA